MAGDRFDVVLAMEVVEHVSDRDGFVRACAVPDVAFTVDGRPFEMQAGETIHTENSHKYGPNGGRMLLRAGGWTPIREWTDPQDWFGLILCEAQPLRMAP